MSAGTGSDTIAVDDISDTVLTADSRLSDTESAYLEDLADTHFSGNDALDENTMKSIQFQESSAGVNLRLDAKPPGGARAAGLYQIKKSTAERFLDEDIPDTATTKTDPRFDERKAAEIATEYVATLDDIFKEGMDLGVRNATAISDTAERKKATLAAYNMGEGNVAQAQKLAEEAGGDPTDFSDVRERFDEAAGQAKAEEARNYVDDVTRNERGFDQLDRVRSSPEPDDGSGDSGSDGSGDSGSGGDGSGGDGSGSDGGGSGSGGPGGGSGGSKCPTPPKPPCKRYERKRVFAGYRAIPYPPFYEPVFRYQRICVE